MPLPASGVKYQNAQCLFPSLCSFCLPLLPLSSSSRSSKTKWGWGCLITLEAEATVRQTPAVLSSVIKTHHTVHLKLVDLEFLLWLSR